MFLGLRTAIYRVRDIDQAKSWYTSILGSPPYFDEPFYVGFNVGGYELGLMPREDGATPDSVTAYWGVESAEAAFRFLLEKGATSNEEVQDVGGGIKVATVKDPLGNIFGIIENPHFKIG
jgi:catechol 2,3-dioxygenase-like lactoylglutathione lyase family enzyme